MEWNTDLFGGLHWVHWRGLRFQVEITRDGWRASCRFVNGAPDGMAQAAGGLAVWPDMDAAKNACRRHARRALKGEYR